MPLDDRTIMGESVWVKACKFAFSFFAYCLSLAWLLSHMTKLRRTGWAFGTLFAVISAAEVGVGFAASVLVAAAGIALTIRKARSAPPVPEGTLDVIAVDETAKEPAVPLRRPRLR